MKKAYLLCLALMCYFAGTGQLSAQLPETIPGEWDVWISGAVTYRAQDAKIVQEYTPGAAMNRLRIEKHGAYSWGESKGKLQEVRPWYAEEGKQYFRISDLKGNTYDFWHKPETDQLILLFGEVGGHAATGSRWPAGKQKYMPGTSKPGQQAKPAGKPPVHAAGARGNPPAAFRKNDKVEILWSGSWYKGRILEIRNNKFLVHYDGWGSLYDEWVTADKLRPQ